MNSYSTQLSAQDVREVLAKAAESKESALKFLKDAGILDIKSEPKAKSAQHLKEK